jgi:hypothetical protein
MENISDLKNTTYSAKKHIYGFTCPSKPNAAPDTRGCTKEVKISELA